jgi:hypothetical protein
MSVCELGTGQREGVTDTKICKKTGKVYSVPEHTHASFANSALLINFTSIILLRQL